MVLRVLLLEDNPDDAFLINRELKDIATVDVAITGSEFKRMLSAEKWDVVLLDFTLPTFSGEDAIKEIKERGSGVPFILVTGSIDHRIAGNFLRSGAEDYILKEELVQGSSARLRHAVVRSHENHMLRRQAMRDNRLEILGHTTAGFTHDMNNMLQAFVAGPEILRKLLSDIVHPLPEAINRVLCAMESSGQRGVDMSKQVTAFVRGSNGNVMKTVSSEFILTELGKLLRESFPKNIQVALHTTPGTFPVKCDVTQIIQLLLNLAINARDSMKGGGELHISAQNTTFALERLKGGFVSIQIRDTGTGIKPEHMERIWEHFWTTKPVGQGTGLGLPMARKIAMDHGGDIDVKSGTGGTSFFVYLPVAVDETRSEKLIRMDEFDGHGKTVMICDDESHMRLMIEMFLVDANYKALVASSGMEALSLFRSNAHIDLLLTDCGMPLMSGSELAEALRGQNYTLPIVFLTGSADQGQLAASETVLRKPFSRFTLLSTLRDVLAQPVTQPDGPGAGTNSKS